MGGFCGALFGMKLEFNSAVLILSSLALGVSAARAQQNPAGHAKNFSSVEYFEPPREQMVKSRLSGAEAQPLAGGRLLITQLKLETFNTNGEPGLIVKAPECVYDTLHGVASSPGHLRLETADGSSHVEGDGFLWRQTDSFLTISNDVQTVIEAGPKKKTGS